MAASPRLESMVLTLRFCSNIRTVEGIKVKQTHIACFGVAVFHINVIVAKDHR